MANHHDEYQKSQIEGLLNELMSAVVNDCAKVVLYNQGLCSKEEEVAAYDNVQECKDRTISLLMGMMKKK